MAQHRNLLSFRAGGSNEVAVARLNSDFLYNAVKSHPVVEWLLHQLAFGGHPLLWLGSSRCRGDLGKFVCEPSFRVPQIIGLLHSEPAAGAVAAKLAKPHGHVRGHSRVTGQDSVKRLPRNPQLSRRLAHRNSQSRKHILSEQLARMRRLSARPRIYQIFAGHNAFFLNHTVAGQRDRHRLLPIRK
jgi:hypothetical protein